MPLDPHAAAARYAIIRDELRQQAPTAWAEVVKLAQAVPMQITPDSFWQFGKDKPCWSNIREVVGGRLTADLKASPDFQSSSAIAGPAWEIYISPRNVDWHWKKNENFKLVGPAAQAFVERLPPGGLSSYRWRLCAIREFAKALNHHPELRQMIQQWIDDDFNFGNEGAYKWACRFAKYAGRGWGAISVMHLLTDLGRGVKPDLWLCRSAVYMGLLSPQISTNLLDKDIKKINPGRIVEVIMAMAPYVDPVAAPGASSALREIDKVMMEWSKQGLAHPF